MNLCCWPIEELLLHPTVSWVCQSMLVQLHLFHTPLLSYDPCGRHIELRQLISGFPLGERVQHAESGGVNSKGLRTRWRQRSAGALTSHGCWTTTTVPSCRNTQQFLLYHEYICALWASTSCQLGYFLLSRASRPLPSSEGYPR